MKVVYKTAPKPVDSRAFLKHIICNRSTFPCLHLFLSCCLALAPGDAVVEQPFSQLTRLLAPQRLRISTKLVEQFMILELDSVPWTEYNLTLSRKTCALMRDVHASVWHVLIMVSRSPKGRASRCPRMRRGAQVRKGSGLKTPRVRTVILQISQAPPIHHLTQAVRTVNRLLIWLQKFLKSGAMLMFCVRLWWLPGWVGPWLSNTPSPLGVGHFWVPGFPQILDGWVLKFTPPPAPPRH